MNRLPPVSPYGLIQEVLWPDHWGFLVACVMLNQTTRRQVEKVLPRFLELCRTPAEFLDRNEVEIKDVIRSLGFANRRYNNLFGMATKLVEGDWTHARELPGIGEYGARAWEMFFKGTIGNEVPNDHALKDYYKHFSR